LIDASQMLRRFLRGFRQLSGAEAASLFVPSALAGPSAAILLHEGEAEPVAEMSGVAEAHALHERFATGRLPGGYERGLPNHLAGRHPATWLIPLPASETSWAAPTSGNGRTDGDPGSGLVDPPVAWVGLRFAQGLEGDRPHPGWASRDGDSGLVDWLCSLGGAIASHTTEVAGALRDPVTGLPDRVGLQAELTERLQRCRRSGRSLALLFVNPDDFAVVNERFGREAGDRMLLEISRRLREALGPTDALARYGGAIFAAVVSKATLDTARSLAAEALPALMDEPYQGGALRLSFSIGIAAAGTPEDGTVDALEMMRRADHALDAAKRLGGGCVADWREGPALERHGVDRLSGIFTGNMAKDYRNMILLSDTLDAIASKPDFEGLAGEVVERLYATFRPDRVALFGRDEQGEIELLRGLTRNSRATGSQRRLETIELEPPLLELLLACAGTTEPRLSRGESILEGGLAVALPLRAGDHDLGALYLDGRADSLTLDSSDLSFLRALAGQLSVALDRARLSEADSRRQAQERQRLRAELNELRHALQQAKLVYRSSEMDRLLTAARRVAPTDATVLLSGESGTGKELLARTLHELSPRRELPMVVVDCGAIAPSLIESELFGHERGAYAGAGERRTGRLAEASRGTLLLDEVSELPLGIQSRLLRFVQEKQFVTVGGNRPHRVDVRILAATNRDLAREVANGRFREDLFHRLNVIQLRIPPLRDRSGDITYLARHFLEIYALQYHKHIRGLTSEAKAAILAYRWPGNVRELQNRIMQAVILCETEQLGPEELQLPHRENEPAATASPGTVGPPPTRLAGRPWAVRPPAASRAGRTPSSPTALAGDPLARLRLALALQIEVALATTNHDAFPLGKWLEEDLVLEAHAASEGVSRRGALLTGLPETTFRRRARRASDRARAGFSPRTGNWDQVRSALADVVRELGDSGDNLLTMAEAVLLDEIVARMPNEPGTGAKLLGVTPPTFRVRLGRRTEN
jgi:diguanylate cyclase (GGDEF)-like protein